MSLKTSQALPVENYSVIQQSENGTQFGPNNKIRFRIGSHLGYIDFKTSYLQWNLEVQNAKAKMEFTNGMGADVLIRTWRVLIGGHIIEEIDHPNVLLKTWKYDYGQDLGMREISEVLDKSGNGTGYKGLNKTGAAVNITLNENPCALVKCILDLNFSGIFGSSQTFPVGLTGDVEIEITLEDQRKCFQVIQDGYQPFCLTDTTSRYSRGCSLGASLDLTGGPTSLTLKESPTNQGPLCKSRVDLEDGSQSVGALKLPNGCPFSVGQQLRISGEGTAVGANEQAEHAVGAVSAISYVTGAPVLTIPSLTVNTNPILDGRLGFAQDGPDGGATNWSNGGSLTYEVSVPSLVLQVVVPPQQYIAEQANKVATEGYAIDVPTFTCYKTNTYADIKSATIDVPCYASRARSIIAIGTDSNQALGGNSILTSPYDMRGYYNDLHQYQFQIGEQREPVRPVDCGNLSTAAHNVSQEQLTELEKALKASGCDVRSLRHHRNNFIIGRALSAYGGSIPLTMKGARIYIDYLQNDKRQQATTTIVAKNWHVFCSHIRRLNITPQGVSVMY